MVKKSYFSLLEAIFPGFNDPGHIFKKLKWCPMVMSRLFVEKKVKKKTSTGE